MDENPQKKRWWLIATAAIVAVLMLYYYTDSWVIVVLFLAAAGALISFQGRRKAVGPRMPALRGGAESECAAVRFVRECKLDDSELAAAVLKTLWLCEVLARRILGPRAIPDRAL